jgi:GTP-binding protein
MRRPAAHAGMSSAGTEDGGSGCGDYRGAVSNFVDECAICVRGGDGGAGCVSFRREAHTPKGGPDGGDGGDGGDVWLVADHNVASLLAFRDHPHRTAPKGTHGRGKNMHGAAGEDLLVKVPEGTVVKDHADGTVLADLVHHGDRWLAGPAGRGGKGNARFLSNRRRAPGFAEQGEATQERWLRLELKLMADVALVGYPNVGKSTLISRISAARPKIADYPFTTLVPNLGVVRITDDAAPFEMVVADIPGLIEGAAEGKGLGHQFLRHIERARVLLMVLDAAHPDGVTPEEQEAVLERELVDYRPELAERARVRCWSRADLAPDLAPPPGVIVISAVTGQGIPELLRELRVAVEAAREATPEPEAYVVHRPVPEGIRVERSHDGAFEVIGREAQRAVALSDLTNLDALAVARERLTSLGVDRALARAGASDGDLVRIGDLEFEYARDEDFGFDGGRRS